MSIPQTLADCREYIETEFTYDCTLLNSNKIAVGSAELATVPDGEPDPVSGSQSYKLRETFHNHTLDYISKKYGDNIIVTKVAILGDAKEEDYEGPIVGSDEEPETLGNLSRHGFYLWPLEQISLHD